MRSNRSSCTVLASSIVLALVCVTPVSAQKAILLVRHGDKMDNSSDAELSDAGRARATHLAGLLRDSGITTIYTTDFKRTRDTAKPLAEALKISPVIVSREPQAVVDRLRLLSAGDAALVVAHSDTLPEILKRLGYPEPVSIADQEYDNLFVVVPMKEGPPAVLRLRY